MKAGFNFCYVIDKKVKRETPLDGYETKLLMGGIDYALQKDYFPKRKTKYKELLSKLNKVIRGW